MNSLKADILSILSSRFAAQRSLYEFYKQAWPHMEGGVPFVDGWCLGAIAEHLEAIFKRQIKRLIINIPPRTSKSNLISIAFPAWVWMHKPEERFLYASYSTTLSLEHSDNCRRLLESSWYRAGWGHVFSLDPRQNAKGFFRNDKFGYRIASSVGASNTGRGGSILVADDPNSVKDVESEVTREDTIRWWGQVFYNRLNNPKEDAIILVQQRSDENDISGYVIKNDENNEYVKLVLPMEFELERRSKTIVLHSTHGKRWCDPRTKERELLWPERFGEREINLFKKQLGSYGYAGQYQQRPSPAGGGILKEEWFKPWDQKDLPQFECILQSWDTALTSSETSCYSACTTWGVFKDKGEINNIMLLSLFKERIEYPDLRKMAIRLANNYMDVYIEDPLIGRNSPDIILIEAKVSGYSLLSDLMRANLPVMKFDPNKHGDKVGRCRLVSHLMENGLVWLPTQPPHYEYYTESSALFIDAAVRFPSSEVNDVIDSMSQAFIRLISTGWVVNKEDPVPVSEPLWKTIDRPYT